VGATRFGGEHDHGSINMIILSIYDHVCSLCRWLPGKDHDPVNGITIGYSDEFPIGTDEDILARN
jgi:hypothetical protein